MTISPVRLAVERLAQGSPLPISLDLIKEQCAVDDNRFDTLLQQYLYGSIAWAEGSTHRTIYERSHTWVLRDFPQTVYQQIRLPRGKTKSVSSVEYVAGGLVKTLRGPSSGSPAGSGFQEDLRGEDGGLIMPNQGNVWPSVDLDVPAPVVITFAAGWPSNEVPEDLVNALLLAIADSLQLRGTEALNMAGKNLEAREAIVSSYRLSRFYGP